MKNILVQTKNDRGGKVRVSTVKPEMELEVFYQDSKKQIRKVNLKLFADYDGLLITDRAGVAYTFVGNPAKKLASN